MRPRSLFSLALLLTPLALWPGCSSEGADTAGDEEEIDGYDPDAGSGNKGSSSGKGGGSGKAGAGNSGGAQGGTGNAGGVAQGGDGGTAGAPAGAGGAGGVAGGAGAPAGAGGLSGASGQGGGGCPPPSNPPSCATCFETSCCNENAACSKNSSCIELIKCMAKCADGDQACENACLVQYPAGIVDHQALTTCFSSKCGFCQGQGGSGGGAGAAGSAGSGAGQGGSGAGAAGAAGSGAAGAGGVCGGSTWSPAACDACMQQKCCAEGNACEADGECAQILPCASKCQNLDPACISSCKEGFASGGALYDKYLGCFSKNCQSCGSSGSGGSSGGGCGTITWNPATCDSCMKASCCAEGGACSKVKGCIDLINCTGNCNQDVQCTNACKIQFPKNVAEFDAYMSCFGANCSSCF